MAKAGKAGRMYQSSFDLGNSEHQQHNGHPQENKRVRFHPFANRFEKAEQSRQRHRESGKDVFVVGEEVEVEQVASSVILNDAD